MHHHGCTEVGVNCTQSPRRSSTCRLVSVTSDDIVTLHESDAVTWRREEALASVTAMLFLDLPAPSPELAAQWRAAAPTLSERVQAEFLSLKASAAACALSLSAICVCTVDATSCIGKHDLCAC